MKRIILLVCLCLLGVFLFRKLTKPPPFQDEVADFIAADKEQMPPPGGILFVGSSSITKWKGIKDSFPGYQVILRGIGGASFPDLERFADKIIFPYHSKQIIIYCGDNDFAYYDNITPEKVFDRFQHLFSFIRNKLPDASIAYISIKPSPQRWKFESQFKATNQLIKSFIGKQQHADFINVHDTMILANGEIDRSLFVEDSLHLNAKGYAVWGKIIKPYLGK